MPVKINAPSRPKWGPFYTASGDIQLPYAELVEPFSVWFDARTSLSRIEYYDGTTRTYIHGTQGKFGTSYMVNPVTDDTKHVLNQVTCFQVLFCFYKQFSIYLLINLCLSLSGWLVGWIQRDADEASGCIAWCVEPDFRVGRRTDRWPRVSALGERQCTRR